MSSVSLSCNGDGSLYSSINKPGVYCCMVTGVPTGYVTEQVFHLGILFYRNAAVGPEVIEIIDGPFFLRAGGMDGNAISIRAFWISPCAFLFFEFLVSFTSLGSPAVIPAPIFGCIFLRITLNFPSGVFLSPPHFIAQVFASEHNGIQAYHQPSSSYTFSS